MGQIRAGSIAATLATFALLAVCDAALHAQIPTQAEAMRLAREDPEAARQALLRSGMDENEIRALLRAQGLPTGALDELLSREPLQPGATVSTSALQALEALGLAEETPDGIVLVELQEGMQPVDARADSLEGPAIFGHEIFTRATSRFQPLLSGPVPDDYRLGPGDRLVLVIAGDVEDAHELEVTRGGFIVIPDVGQVTAANLTFGELRVLLRERLARVYSGIDLGTTTFNLSLTEIRAIQVSVAGEVNQPGAYQLASVATVLNALYAAGGPTELGSMRNVLIQRRSAPTRSFDLYPYILSGDVSADVTLEQGDVVHVPLRGRRVQLVGAVLRPAFYELGSDDDLVDVLDISGGFAPDARRERLTIHRVLRPADRGPGIADRLALDLMLRPSSDDSDHNHVGGVLIPPVGLQDGDSIVVDSVPALRDSYYVTIAGLVRRPGDFPWSEGMTIRDLVGLAGGPVVGADLREAEVSRLPLSREGGALANRLFAALDSSYLSQRDSAGRYVGPPGVPFLPPGASPPFELQPYDQVLIKRQPDFEMPQTVTITGEVALPGDYTLLSNQDRVTDLLDRSGGVLPTGHVAGARLFRSLDELGRMDLDLVAALAEPGGSDNLLLQPGDSLHMPEYSPTVRVMGAVNSPVTVVYQPGEGLDYYIANAGGYRDDAAQSRVSVRYANGQARTRSRFLFWSSYPAPGPGSEVLVPSVDPDAGASFVEVLTPLVSVLGSAAALLIAVTR